MKEFKIWLKYTNNAFQQVLSNRLIIVIFVIGKLLRIGLFIVFLHFLFQGTTSLAGYTRTQIIFFYLSFNFIDTLAQLLYREVYRFRPLIVSGGFDHVLAKPLNPLVRVLLGGGDVIDLIMLVFIALTTVWYGVTQIHAGPLQWLFYLGMIANGLLISTAFHIFVLGIGVLSTSVDHLIMIYRDLTAMLRIPVDLYIEPIRSLLTFVIPLGIMITFPAKILLGLLSIKLVVISITLAIVSFYFALQFWKYSLKHYQSASS